MSEVITVELYGGPGDGHRMQVPDYTDEVRVALRTEIVNWNQPAFPRPSPMPVAIYRRRALRRWDHGWVIRFDYDRVDKSG